MTEALEEVAPRPAAELGGAGRSPADDLVARFLDACAAVAAEPTADGVAEFLGYVADAAGVDQARRAEARLAEHWMSHGGRFIPPKSGPPPS